MATRSLNKVTLIGNLTRDPELRYTPSGTAVCTFGLATNRQWVTESGERKEDAEFHRLVAWQKLAEICGKFLSKGRKIYVDGRIQTRTWTGQDGQQRQTTEIVVEDMIILDSRRDGEEYTGSEPKPVVRNTQKAEKPEKSDPPIRRAEKAQKPDAPKSSDSAGKTEDISPEDIPF